MTTQTETAVSTWQIDADHSFAEFAVKHMMVATVKGSFRIADGTLIVDESDPTRSTVTARIDAASVDSGVAARDQDLRRTTSSAPRRIRTSRSAAPASNGRTTANGASTAT